MRRHWRFEPAGPKRTQEMTKWVPGLLAFLVVSAGERCSGDDFIQAPEPGSTETGTLYPFLLNQMLSPIPTMRYQQVYNSSLFTNADPRSIYLTTLTFRGRAQEFGAGTDVSSMQI